MTWLDVYDLLVIFSLVGLVTVAMVRAWLWWTGPALKRRHVQTVRVGPGTVQNPCDPSPKPRAQT